MLIFLKTGAGNVEPRFISCPEKGIRNELSCNQFLNELVAGADLMGLSSIRCTYICGISSLSHNKCILVQVEKVGECIAPKNESTNVMTVHAMLNCEV